MGVIKLRLKNLCVKMVMPYHRLHRVQYIKTTKVRELIKLIYVYVVGSRRLMPLDALQPKPWSLVVSTCTARYLYQRP